MSYKAQNTAYMLLSKHSGEFTVVDPRTTNAILAKAGISRSNMMSYTMDEICNILGVEYVVDGTITQTLTSSITTSSNSGSNKDSKKEGEKNITKPQAQLIPLIIKPA
ncbi:hypothetical protein [Niabella ginsengisoli]|uniref:Uncharacterized protein n=1 Tax=Niabella ginsengisoli TaxID=522298 RepID=A0ABS9SDZ9_9BACT|nr:hypothetical protein [Niabella ginsengisoli]MCH5596575.1 hypothetical protein [Niabella ginsengisoli]